MYWLIYSFASICICHLVGNLGKKNYMSIFLVTAIFLFTPAQIESTFTESAPSVFTFIFNVIFEKDFSTRPLRPLLLSIPTTIFGLFLFYTIKRKFF